MSWYYAGSDARPFGPVSLEELRSLRAAGTVTPDTYVIEHTGPSAANLAWRRYQDAVPALPVETSPAPVLSTPPPAPAATTQPPPAHPLFPSASPGGYFPPASAQVYPGMGVHPALPAAKPTNALCAWGFGLSVLGFLFSIACGIGVIPGLIGLVLCVIGLVQVSRNRVQGGHALAITGLILSGLTLIIGLIILISFGVPMLKAHSLTITEQTSNDSE